MKKATPALSTKTPVPSSIFISRLPSGLFSLGCHLRTGMTVGRQFDTPPCSWAELVGLLEEWHIDPEEFLMRHFDWNPATIDRQIRSSRLPSSNPLATISLADLGF